MDQPTIAYTGAGLVFIWGIFKLRKYSKLHRPIKGFFFCLGMLGVSVLAFYLFSIIFG